MLHIVWTVLKILGILLAAVLGILLLLMVLVLFVPVRYQADAGLGEETRVSAKISWLLHAFGVQVRYMEGTLSVKLRLLWFLSFPLYPAKEKRAGQQKEKKKKEKRKEKSKQKEAPLCDAETAEKKERSDIPKTGETNIAAPVAVPKRESDSLTEKRPGIWERLLSVLKKLWALPGRLRRGIQGILEKVKYTFRMICVKITDIRANWKYYTDMLKKEEVKNAFSLCRRQLMRLLRHAAPRKLSGDLTIGLEDPATTGQLYGLYCASGCLHRYRIAVTPDFEQKILKGTIRLRGHVRGIHLLILGLKLLFDKNIRYLIKELRQS